MPRPSWYRYLQAATALHDEAKPASESGIARELGISRPALWRLHRRNPGLKAWAHAQFMEGNEHLVGPVIRMLGTVALRTKSPRHAELFLRAVGALDSSRSELDCAPTELVPPVVNVLVPRPDWPPLPQPTATPVAETPRVPVIEIGDGDP